jgi:hypothetical protein
MWYSTAQHYANKISKSKQRLSIKLYPDFISNVQCKPISHVPLCASDLERCHLIEGGGGIIIEGYNMKND